MGSELVLLRMVVTAAVLCKCSRHNTRVKGGVYSHGNGVRQWWRRLKVEGWGQGRADMMRSWIYNDVSDSAGIGSGEMGELRAQRRRRRRRERQHLG